MGANCSLFNLVECLQVSKSKLKEKHKFGIGPEPKCLWKNFVMESPSWGLKLTQTKVARIKIKKKGVEATNDLARQWLRRDRLLASLRTAFGRHARATSVHNNLPGHDRIKRTGIFSRKRL